jgi:hypothetical protein
MLTSLLHPPVAPTDQEDRFSIWFALPTSAPFLFWIIAILIAVAGYATATITTDALIGAYALDVAIILLCLEIYTAALVQTGLLEKVVGPERRNGECCRLPRTPEYRARP